VIIGLVILATARLFVPYEVQNWPAAILFLVLTSVSFCLFGFILGVLADGFEKLQIVPMLILTPLTFLGGTFYSLNMLPEFWQRVTLFNPVVYLISGFRWAFFGADAADVDIVVSLVAISGFLTVCLAAVWWIFKTGYRLKN
jgi:ABC-2 type transport system permease protein